eukprot:2786395-Pyramimonas_sp.AAC.1
MASAPASHGPGAAFKCPAVPALRPPRPHPDLERRLRPRLCWWPADGDDELLSGRPGSLEMALGQL